jgi:hypothetical protein
METVNRTATHAVLWREGDGPARVGRLELRPARLHLEGGGAGGRLFSMTIPYSDLARVAMARPELRLSGRQTLEVMRSGGRPIRIASVEGLGTTRDIFDRLAGLVPGAAAA